MSLFSANDEKRISEAIRVAEKTTSGEIVAVVATQSDSYLYVPFLVAAMVALLVPWPFIYLTWMQVQWIYLIQLLVFAAIVALTFPAGRRLWFVPASVKRMHAHRRAVEQFLVQNLHTTDGRTGVLIFVSLAERYAEIVADKGIHRKVAEGTWQEIVDQLTTDMSQGKTADGFTQAIAACGKHLAKHFPPGSHDANELPNHLIVLR
jgi:putative membrane protein